MAGIDPVTMSDGRVLEINNDTCEEIYTEMRKGLINLTSAQKSKLNTFLTDEIRDAVEYVTAEEDGKSKIDTTGTEDGNGTKGAAIAGAVGSAAGAAGATGGTIFAILHAISNQQLRNAGKEVPKDGFCALPWAIVTLVGAGLAFAMSFRDIFDPDASTREALMGANDGNMSLLDAQKQGLIEGMDLMQQDQQDYADNAAIMTEEMNINAGLAADLMAQIMEAEASGETKTAEELKKQLAEIQGADYSHYQEVLDAIVAGQQDYDAYTGQSRGMSQSGTTVAEFLKFGHPLSKIANACVIMSTVAAALITVMAVVAAIPKKWVGFVPVDLVPAISSAVMFVASAVLMWGTVKKMGDNKKFEEECGQAGDALAEKVAALNGEIEGSQQTIEDTNASIGATNDAEADKQQQGQDAADKALANATKGLEGGGDNPPTDNPPPEK